LRFGFHLSIAGGFSKMIERARVRGCETFQFFSRNPRGWKYDSLDEAEVGRFRAGLKGSGLSPVFIHLPYLPNIACRRSDLYPRSVDSVAADLERAERLGADYLIIHVGHRMEETEEEGMAAVSAGIDEALGRVRNRVKLLLEITAGQGSEVGYTFEQLKRIIDGAGQKSRVGICLDTAHAFGAGYDLSTKDGLERTLETVERTVGLKRVHLLHLNDSKAPLGSRRDRHTHIGEGYIGLEGFRGIVNHPLLRHLPGIMETPRTDTVEDIQNMKVIRSLIE
jgi:deoxyribonuclease-4